MQAHDLVEHNMTNHPPVNDDVVRMIETLRTYAKDFAKMVVTVCPDSRERSLAVTKAEESLMWAVAAIARNQEVVQ